MFATEEEVLKVCTEGDSKLFNEILERVYNKAIEQALCHIPMVVNKLSKKVQATNAILNKYFQDHPDFAEHKDIVITTVQKIEMEYTGMLFEDILDKATPEIAKKIANIKGVNNANS